MVWTLDMDDYMGTFCNQGKYPLINVLKKGLNLEQACKTFNTVECNMKPRVIRKITMISICGVFLACAPPATPLPPIVGMSTTTGSSSGGSSGGGSSGGGSSSGGSSSGGDSGTSGMDSGFCAGKANGMYPNPKDKNQFYNCASGKTYFEHCASGLVFDSSCSCCNWS